MTTYRIADRDYEVITFRRKLTNKSEEMSAISLARGYLAIADQYRIYNTISGEPILRGRFTSRELALKLATWIEKELWDFFEIWDAYPTANIISWCKFTAEFGARLFETIEGLSKLEIITDNDLTNAYNQAKEMEKRWIR